VAVAEAVAAAEAVAVRWRQGRQGRQSGELAMEPEGRSVGVGSGGFRTVEPLPLPLLGHGHWEALARAGARGQKPEAVRGGGEGQGGQDSGWNV
jgi:hypothetical protein